MASTMQIPHQDTIVAQSTHRGNGAIGIIRLSGPDAISLLNKVWRGTLPVNQWQPRHVHVGSIHKFDDTQSVLDQAVSFWMKAPHSYTGEDVVEVQVHGGQRLIEVLVKNFIHAGARMAEPGEFTKRAFLNGRLDLTQAEAIADLIQSSSDKAAELAQRQLEGRLSDYVQHLRNELKIMRAQMEAMIDFPEDEDVQGLHDFEVTGRIERVMDQIRKLLETWREGHFLREGIRVAIIGKPNAGKSSLFNSLLRTNRAIVHDIPGTTRDLIEESLDLEGLIVRFIDTAGIRQGEDFVESEGIRRTTERIKQSDLVLAVFDASRPWNHEDEMVFGLTQGLNTICLLNKIDLEVVCTEEMIRSRIKERELIIISAKNGAGIDPLKKKIYAHFIRHEPHHDEIILTNTRHCAALEKGLSLLNEVRQSSLKERPLDCLVSDLGLAMDRLGEITGEVTNDEILGEIFSRFCIGK